MVDVVVLVWGGILAAITTALSILYWDHRMRKYNQARYYTGRKISPQKDPHEMSGRTTTSSSASVSSSSTARATWHEGSSPAEVMRRSRLSRSQPADGSSDGSSGQGLPQATAVEQPSSVEQEQKQAQEQEQEQEQPGSTSLELSGQAPRRTSFIDDLAELSHRVFGGGTADAAAPGESRPQRNSTAGRIETISEWSSEGATEAPTLAPAGQAAAPTGQTAAPNGEAAAPAAQVSSDATAPETHLSAAPALASIHACEDFTVTASSASGGGVPRRGSVAPPKASPPRRVHGGAHGAAAHDAAAHAPGGASDSTKVAQHV